MRKVLLAGILLAFISVAEKATAQGTLQFNQVVNAEYSASVNTSSTVMGTIVVPAGKVLKIESVSFVDTTPNRWVHWSTSANVFIENHAIYHNGSNLFMTYVPMWLSAGTYTIYARVSSTTDSAFSYSGIEFNIIP